MKSSLFLAFALNFIGALSLSAADLNFDQWADNFAADWVRADPQTATISQYFDGAEQDQLDRQLVLSSGVNAARREAALAQRGLQEIARYANVPLTPRQRTTAAVIRWQCEQTIESEKFARHRFIFDQFRGLHVTLVNFLTARHPIRNQRDAENYLARLARVGPVMDEGIAETLSAAEAGFLPPRFILERCIEQLNKFTGAEPASNPLVATFSERLLKLGDKISEPERQRLVAAAQKELRATILHAYLRARSLLESQLPKAKDDAGMWTLPNGDAAYRHALRNWTTTTLTPDEIHQIGLREVANIESEMDAILRKLGHSDGPLQERMNQLMAKLPKPSDPDPRPALLERISEIIRDAERRSETAFDLRPTKSVIVKREPAMTEKTASAHYTPPAPDGSQPGIYWVPMADISPKSDWIGLGLKTVAYHEAIPGHHFQVALQQEIPDLPRYRKYRIFGFNSAFGEGWALYAERLAMENGWYEGDLLGQLGYLSGQLLRARRLVVDTGLHAKKWTRQQVLDYGISAAETERYIVLQGQACAYMIGQLRILDLREKSKKALGEKFSIKQFHNIILRTGTVPLDILEQEVDAWIKSQ